MFTFLARATFWCRDDVTGQQVIKPLLLIPWSLLMAKSTQLTLTEVKIRSNFFCQSCSADCTPPLLRYCAIRKKFNSSPTKQERRAPFSMSDTGSEVKTCGRKMKKLLSNASAMPSTPLPPPSWTSIGGQALTAIGLDRGLRTMTS